MHVWFLLTFLVCFGISEKNGEPDDLATSTRDITSHEPDNPLPADIVPNVSNEIRLNEPIIENDTYEHFDDDTNINPIK
ncbi:hypothetical protein L1887_38824 [Cichorium endivia]|nr:hypothetical protein L1887_38824 [Cichorium endivia]